MVEIAKHFDISYVNPIGKQELFDLLVSRLEEKGMFRLPTQTVPPESADGASDRGDRERDSGAPPAGDRGHAETLPVPGTPQGDMTGKTGAGQIPLSLPRYEPFSPGSDGSRDEARLKVRLARMQIEAQERAQERQMRLEIKRLEIQAEQAVRIRQLELEAQARLPVSPAADAHTAQRSPSGFPADVTASSPTLLIGPIDNLRSRP
ncbi:uncharacterized protein LOC118598333, partial [Oryzias melastigma]|uniref:uncharacterized protein LOC118598333 n=1 Tax=Oryzias melastigma TaxID=30732 RepID=UPI00168D5534